MEGLVGAHERAAFEGAFARDSFLTFFVDFDSSYFLTMVCFISNIVIISKGA